VGYIWADISIQGGSVKAGNTMEFGPICVYLGLSGMQLPNFGSS
jgi:hypothetical protein